MFRRWSDIGTRSRPSWSATPATHSSDRRGQTPRLQGSRTRHGHPGGPHFGVHQVRKKHHLTKNSPSLLSPSRRLQTHLATHGIPTQTQKQVEPIKIRPPGDILMKVYARLGENAKLGLTGRPKRPLGALATSRVRGSPCDRASLTIGGRPWYIPYN